MTQTLEHNLFALDEPDQVGLFADVVFDRPLDHAFTYFVGDTLRSAIAVGKRVRAPFGRGDRNTVGYCVRLTETPPERRVKELVAVLDDEALLTDNLLRLTRWMADYYLCGWGQVLNAVVPAGARDRAGTRQLAFLEAIPEIAAPDDLTPKQKAVLEHLRGVGRPVEARDLTRRVRCGSTPIEALVSKGLVRRITRRVDKFTDSTDEAAIDQGPIVLNEDQQRVWSALEPSLRQGGFHAFLLHGVTGSGKTEIYLRAIQEVVRQG
jgi:primosomal protein N' (replication factor Y)